MAYKLRLGSESDASGIVDVQFSSPSAFRDASYPKGINSTITAKKVKETEPDLVSRNVIIVVAVSALDLSQVVGFAKWRVFSEPEDFSAGPKTIEAQNGVEENVALRREFTKQLHEHRVKNLKGKPYSRLSNLFVHEDHQRRGIGRSLMEYGLALADERKLPVYVEATAVGVPLYTKYGFKEVSTFDIPLADYTDGKVSEVHHHTLMLRDAKDGVKQVQRGHRKTYSFQA